MILVDLSQTIIANCIVHMRDLASSTPEDSKKLIKHSFFMTLLSYKKKYGKAYGEIVLAADSKTYWRRDYFPAYKGHRKHHREAGAFDWKLVFETINELKREISENFIYKVIEVDDAEADDVVAVLCKYLQENDLIQDGVFDEEPQPILILSSDGDFIQLHKYKNVKQWSPLVKKFIVEKDIEAVRIEHICRGDDGDNVPNIMTPDSWANERAYGNKPPRQGSLKKEFLESVIKGEKITDEEVARNWIRNKTLIDFDEIPEKVSNKIIDTYKEYHVKGSKTKMMSYFGAHGMKVLFGSIGEF